MIFNPTMKAFLTPRRVSAAPVYDSQTILLGHFDGTEGSKQFTDSSMYAWSSSWYGVGTITTGSYKFGSAAYYHPNNGATDTAGIRISSSFFNISASTDWTFEYFYKQIANGWNFQILYSNTWAIPAGQGGWAIIHNSGPEGLAFYMGPSNITTVNTTSFSDGNWHHVAIVRNGTAANNVKYYLDGTAIGQTTWNNPMTCSAANLNIGYTYGAGNQLYGYIDEVRFSKGIARYTANFTPPTAAFSAYL